MGKCCTRAQLWVCLKYNEDWCDKRLQWSVWLIQRDGENLQWKLLKCHWVVRRRVSSVPLVACSPAESVCPPGPEHAPPPLSELFPWQWCRGGRTWWSSLLLGKSVVEGEKRENVCVFTLCHVFLNLKLSHAAICQHGSVTLTPYWLNLTLFSPLVVLEYNSKKLISSDYKNV